MTEIRQAGFAIPVIALVCTDEVGIRQQCSRVGCDDADALVTAVRGCVRKPQISV